MSFTKDKDSDNYTSDKNAWEIIKKYIPTDKIIWSPFFSDGKQKKYFKELGFDIIHKDEDFFSYTPEYDLIVDNIPFSKNKEIFHKLKKLDKQFIIISPPKLFLLKIFTNLFNDHLHLIIPHPRPTFTHLSNPKKNYTPPFGVWYFCFKMNLHKDLIILE